MAAGDVLAVKMHITFAGQQCRPGFYIIEGAGYGFTNPCEGAAAYLFDNTPPTVMADFSIATTFLGVEVQDVQPGTNKSFFRAFPGGGYDGTVADDNPVPPQDSMLIRWDTVLKSGKGKKATRSRTYLPGIYSTGQISGFLITELQDALSAFASVYFDTLVTDGTFYQMHAVHFVPNTNPRVVDAFTPITSFSVDNQVDIQRRRRPGRGI